MKKITIDNVLDKMNEEVVLFHFTGKYVSGKFSRTLAGRFKVRRTDEMQSLKEQSTTSIFYEGGITVHAIDAYNELMAVEVAYVKDAENELQRKKTLLADKLEEEAERLSDKDKRYYPDAIDILKTGNLPKNWRRKYTVNDDSADIIWAVVGDLSLMFTDYEIK